MRAKNLKLENACGVERRFVNERIVAATTGRSVKTLQKDRRLRRGFPYYKLGKQVLYDLIEVEAVIRSGRIQ